MTEEKEGFEPKSIQAIAIPDYAKNLSLERSAQIYAEHVGLDFDTAEKPIIEKPERVKAPLQLLVILMPNSKRDHVVGRMEIFEVGGEEVYDERGTKSPLGGNSKIYWCPHCKIPILSEWHSGVFVVCSHCTAMIKPKDLIGEVILSHSPVAAAKIIRRAHMQLQFADLYVMRFLSLPEVERKHYTRKDSDEMNKALYERVCVLYPFHKLALAVHSKSPLPGTDAYADFETALEGEIRRYI